MGFRDVNIPVLVEKKAVQIVLGEGMVKLTLFTDPDGKGIFFMNTGVAHEVGSYTGDEPGLHEPQPGEVYIKCLNVEGAQVLLEMVQELVDSFSSRELNP